MISIYPFKAAMPKADKLDFVNKLFSGVTLHNNNLISCGNKIQYIESQLDVNLFKDKISSFYCCRIKCTGENFAVNGLVGLIDIRLLNQEIFMHEKCIKEKQDQYKMLFSKHKLQTAPVILMHEHNNEVSNSLNLIQESMIPFLKIDNGSYKYELWRVNNHKHFQTLYAKMDSLLIADGHHRIAAMRSLNDYQIVAFLVSKNQIKSSDILRIYNKVNNDDIKKLLYFLDKTNILEKADSVRDDSLSTDFLCKLENFVYQTSRDNKKNIRDVLEYLDELINYKDKNLNFVNYPYNKSTQPLFHKNKIGLVIPSYEMVNKIQTDYAYPPHSTLFYPKLPEGLISYKIKGSLRNN